MKNKEKELVYVLEKNTQYLMHSRGLKRIAEKMGISEVRLKTSWLKRQTIPGRPGLRVVKRTLQKAQELKRESLNKRVPRPLGTTLLARGIENREERLNEVRKWVIKNYVIGGFQINGVGVNLPDFARLIGVNERMIHQQILDSDMYGVNKLVKNPERLLSVLFGQIFWASTNDRAEAMKQYHILSKSQGDTYRPYISAEVNNSIKNLHGATKGMMDLLKVISGISQNNIFNIQATQINENNFISTADAVKMITEQKGQGVDLQGLLERYGQGLPDVNAITQGLTGEFREGGKLNLKPDLKVIKKKSPEVIVSDDFEIIDGVE